MEIIFHFSEFSSTSQIYAFPHQQQKNKAWLLFLDGQAL
jgi:hypothetical protein